MPFFRLLLAAALLGASVSLVSCESLDDGPKPPQQKVSSMPHNIPADWEGRAGMPGMMGGGY